MTAMILLSEWERSQTEFWMPVAGWLGYDVSSKGRIRSFRRQKALKGNGKRWTTIMLDTPHIMSSTPDGGGYLQVGLCGGNGIRRSRKVHKLVANAFVKGERLPEVNHITGLKSDNRVGNLEFMTHGQNVKHAHDIGLKVATRGEAQPKSKMTNVTIVEIRRRSANGEKTRPLAREFGIHQKTAMSILRGQTWRHLLPE
jgi:hypothetical protein